MAIESGRTKFCYYALLAIIIIDYLYQVVFSYDRYMTGLYVCVISADDDTIVCLRVCMFTVVLA